MYGVSSSSVIRTDESVIVAPTAWPLTVAYAKQHIRSLNSAEDTLVQAWIAAATSYFEEQTGRQIMTATREYWLDRFPVVKLRLELPRPPLQEVTSVLYVAGDGTLTSFSDGLSPETLYYTTKAPAGEYCNRGWVEPLTGTTWPIAREESGAVRIQFTCGYGDLSGPVTAGGSVPDLIIGCLCFLIGNFDQYRSSRPGFEDLPLGIRMLIDGFKYSAYPREGPPR